MILSGGTQKKKGITRKGLGGKKLGAATTVEPMAEVKPIETVRMRMWKKCRQVDMVHHCLWRRLEWY